MTNLDELVHLLTKEVEHFHSRIKKQEKINVRTINNLII